MKKQKGLLTWDYRIISEGFGSGDDNMYSVHEVFYNERDEITDYVKTPICLVGTDLDDMVHDIQVVLEAFEKPIINAKVLP